MKIILKNMQIQNFKGIKSKRILFSDKTKIHGANGTGKSTIQDAFLWLLFGKDSNGNSSGSDNFREKPLDEKGNEIHNLETSVSARLEIDDVKLKLEKQQSENWVKRIGSENAEYAGNTTKYFIDEVPVKQKDYALKIASLVDEKIFRLITTLGAFNALNWKERREILLSLVDADIDSKLLQEEKYLSIASELNGLTVDDLKIKLFATVKKFNEELKTIPSRIDEATNLLPNVSKQDTEKAEKIIESLEKEKHLLEQKIINYSKDDEYLKIKYKIAEKEEELAAAKNTADYYASKLEADLKDGINKLNNRIEQLDNLVKNKQENYEYVLDSLKKDKEKLEKLRDEYRNQASKQYVQSPNVQYVCPTCNQDMPVEMLEKAIENDKAEFNRRKQENLKVLNETGAMLKSKVEATKQRLDEIKNSIDEQSDNLKESQQNLDALNKAEKPTPDYTKANKIAEEIESLNKKLNSLSDNSDVINELKANLSDTDKAIGDSKKIIASYQLGESIRTRIVELEEKQKKFGIELARTEKILYLIDMFISERCLRLESSINEYFPTVKWKLFDVQINGGLNPSCTCMIPCNDSLVVYNSANTASQVNADIEIINVLNEYYDVSAPLFIDNAERVNNIAKTQNQLITLSVSEAPELIVNNI